MQWERPPIHFRVYGHTKDDEFLIRRKVEFA
eukprot:SAG11_NODE_14763_length_600_cov_1.508982_2_plen_30_part_01